MFKYLTISRNSKLGFSLMEMVIAVGIFSVIMIIAIGITIQIINVQHKSTALQAIQDNARFSLELMTKELRTGSEYVVGTPCGFGTGIEFTSTSEESATKERVYFLKDEKIWRIVGTTGNCGSEKQFTSDEIAIDSLVLSVHGAAPTRFQCDGQPSVTITIRLHATDSRYNTDSYMSLQTTVVQRLRDMEPLDPVNPCP